LKFDAYDCPYTCIKYPVYGKSGMVATSQALAAGAGMEILKKGGNAVDAAIAAAACLTVTEPTSNGSAVMLLPSSSMGDELYGLNASGPAPLGISIDKTEKAGL